MEYQSGNNLIQHIASSGTGHQHRYSGQSHQINSGGGTINNYNAANATLDDNAREDILRTLYTSPYLQRKDRNPDRVPGTCEWFMSHDHFQHWRDGKSSSMLWVSANPGCGKSVLAKHLVEHFKERKSTTICYFFFKDDFKDQRSANSALSCILHQLFIQKQDLFSTDIIKRFKTYKIPLANSYFGLWELWDILTMAAQNKNSGEIICVLDAFDECEDEERQDFSKILTEFYGPINNTKKSVKLKFLVTSRPYDKIRQGFEEILDIPDLPVIRLKGDGHTEVEMISQEINIYIKNRVSRIQKNMSLTGSENGLLLQGLMAIPSQTYLWVYLTLDWIESKISNKINEAEIQNIITTLPRTVDEAYDKILAKSVDPRKTKKLLHIVVAAKRPLTLSEMDLALNKTLQRRPNDRISKYIRDLCGLFVTITDEKIYLLHQTAKEFLVVRDNVDSQKNSPEGRQDEHPLTWKFSLIPSTSHRILCKICLWYLLLTKFETHPPTAQKELANYLRDNIFFEYSAKNWAIHLRESDVEEYDIIESLQRICDATSNRCLTWFTIYWTGTQTDFPLNFTTLMIASYFGIELIVRFELEVPDLEIDSVDNTYRRSALSWASENGFDGVVKLLINGPKFHLLKALKNLSLPKGAMVNARDSQGRTPLFYATWNSHLTIVKRLVKAGARADLKDEIGGTPISYALSIGQEEIANELTKEVHADSIDKIRHELLLSAAIGGHEPVVKRLLDSGAHMEVEDGHKRTPLYLAIEYRRVAVVRLLLEKGARVGNNCNLLIHAISKGEVDIVEMLLKSRADANASDRKGRTLLYYAIIKGKIDIVEMLLKSKADANAKDKDSRTLLYYAIQKGIMDIIEMLLKSKADTNAYDNNCCTSLHYAIKKGRTDIVKILLKSKADVNASDREGCTSLHYAIQKGRMDIVKILLKSRADANTSDKEGRTSLHYAVIMGKMDIVDMLLESRADANASDRRGRTPLYFATVYAAQKTDIVAMLLKQGADVNAEDRHDRRTPLTHAIEQNEMEIVEMLLNRGAKMNYTIDRERWGSSHRVVQYTPLLYAINLSNSQAVELLLRYGAQPNFKGHYRSTPLELAIRLKNKAIIEMVQSAVKSYEETGKEETAL